jgi:spore germination protein YaaH
MYTSIKKMQENTTKQVKEFNKTFQDLKMEIETIKKSQRKEYNTGNRKSRKEIRSHRFKHHQQNTREKSQVQKIP